MKKIISLLLCVLVVLSLGACAPADNSSIEGTTTDNMAATEKAFLAGFGQGDITPNFPIGLTGFGDESTRIWDGMLSKIYTLVLAVTDTEGNTAIMISNDLANTNSSFYDTIANWCNSEYGIPKENVIISAIHQHSVPTFRGDYEEFITPITKKAIKDAMEDRSPAEMYINTVETDALNFVRHYWNKEGEMYGNNYGTKGSGLVSHETDVDNKMHLVKFDRGEDKKDIIVANFRAHPIMAPSVSYTGISSDWIGYMRDDVKKALDCEIMYFSGAGGNVNTTSEIKEENKSTDMKDQGKRAANYVIKAEDSYTKVETGPVKGYQVTNIYDTDHSMDHLVELAMPAYNLYMEGKLAEAKAEAAKHPEFHSVYHAKNVVSKASAGATKDLLLSVVSLGDVAFTSHAYEMFDTNGMELQNGTVGNENYAAEDQLENPYKLTIIATCSNGHNGYLPSALNCKNGGYSVDITYFAHGTAEKLVTDYLTILNDLHG